MSTSQDRFAAIAENYQSALNSEISDKAKAKTMAEVAAIEANVASAGAVFYSVTADQLTAQSQNIEADYQLSVKANQAVTAARTAAEEISALLAKLKAATDSAGQLAVAAKPLVNG